MKKLIFLLLVGAVCSCSPATNNDIVIYPNGMARLKIVKYDQTVITTNLVNVK